MDWSHDEDAAGDVTEHEAFHANPLTIAHEAFHAAQGDTHEAALAAADAAHEAFHAQQEAALAEAAQDQAHGHDENHAEADAAHEAFHAQ